MSAYMTRKEACAATGYGLTWLKTHQCAWCGQNALYALMYGCASIYGPRCDVVRRFAKPKTGENVIAAAQVITDAMVEAAWNSAGNRYRWTKADAFAALEAAEKARIGGAGVT